MDETIYHFPIYLFTKTCNPQVVGELGQVSNSTPLSKESSFILKIKVFNFDLDHYRS